MKVCTKCLESKSLDEFYLYFNKNLKRKVTRTFCKKCFISSLQKRPYVYKYVPNHLLNPEQLKNKLNTRNKYKRIVRDRNIALGLPTVSRKEYATRKKLRVSRKGKIFEHYGNFCACCGEKEYSLLTVDHINNNGKEHSSSSGRRYSGDRLYFILIELNFPTGIQILCFNCNISKNHNKGTCIHKLKTALHQGTQF